MKDPIQQWFDKWQDEYKNSSFFARDAAAAQVMFVRDELARLVWADVPYEKRSSESGPRNDCKITSYIIGEHHSKSVRLPVYLFERTDLDLRIVMRGNFHDWKLSVTSAKPIESDLFPYLFNTRPPSNPEYAGNELASVYFEGFPKDCVFGYYSENPRRWSACLGQRGLWTVLFLCMHGVGALPPLQIA